MHLTTATATTVTKHIRSAVPVFLDLIIVVILKLS